MQFGFKLIKLRQALLVSSVYRKTASVRIDIHNQIQATRQVINNGQLLGEQQHNIGHIDRVGFVFGLISAKPSFNVANRVVAKIARKTATKTGQTRRYRRFKARQISLCEFNRVRVCRFGLNPVGHYRN